VIRSTRALSPIPTENAPRFCELASFKVRFAIASRMLPRSLRQAVHSMSRRNAHEGLRGQDQSTRNNGYTKSAPSERDHNDRYAKTIDLYYLWGPLHISASQSSAGCGFAPFFSHPARIALTIAVFVMSGAALFSGGNLSLGLLDRSEQAGPRGVTIRPQREAQVGVARDDSAGVPG
jgi:hypothetical protein